MNKKTVKSYETTELRENSIELNLINKTCWISFKEYIF